MFRLRSIKPDFHHLYQDEFELKARVTQDMMDRSVPLMDDIYKEKVSEPEKQEEKLGSVLHVIRDSYKVIVPADLMQLDEVNGVIDRCKEENQNTSEQLMSGMGGNEEQQKLV